MVIMVIYDLVFTEQQIIVCCKSNVKEQPKKDDNNLKIRAMASLSYVSHLSV